MPPRKTDHPTDAELEVLRVLWGSGPQTVREIHSVLATDREVGYTTVLKVMQIMHEKGLVSRDETSKSHVYTAAVEQEETQRQLVGALRDKAFNGATNQLVLQALNAGDLTAEEVQSVRELLDRLEKRIR